MSYVFTLIHDSLFPRTPGRQFSRSRRHRWDTRRRVRLFAPDATDQRIFGLQGACELLAEGFEDLQGLMRQFVEQIPANHEAPSEVEEFLQWLARRDDASAEQQDYIIVQRARLSVEYVTLARQLAHARFQLQLAHAGHEEVNSTNESSVLVHLNPVRVMATLETHALVDSQEMLPATVLFYAVGPEIRSIVVDAEIQTLLQALGHGALTVRKLHQLVDISLDDLAELLEDLRECGVVTLERLRQAMRTTGPEKSLAVKR